MALIRKKKPKKKKFSKPKPAALPPAKTSAPAKMERPQFEVPPFTPSKASVSTGRDFLKGWASNTPKLEFNPEKEFLKTFKELTYQHRSWDVWNDFIVMSACALSNPVDKKHYDEREARYLRIIRKYNKEEQAKFPELFAHMVLALELNPEQDFLGKLYTSLNLQDEGRQQHFTPYSVCELMADITMENVLKQVKENGYITINDPCCGAGATLIAGVHAARKVLMKSGLNFQNHVLVAAQDIDETVALMCYIQLSLLGVAAYIKVGDSLTAPMNTGDTDENYWFTPMYFSDVWAMRRLVHGLDALFCDGGSGVEKKPFRLLLKLEEDDCRHDIYSFYANVARKAGIPISYEPCFDCSKIRVTSNVKDAIFNFYQEKGVESTNELIVMWLSSGPKTDLEEDGYFAEIEDGFVMEGKTDGEI